MRLELDRTDLKEDYVDVHCTETVIDHFKEEVQNAVHVVGEATFYNRKGASDERYNVIKPPQNAVGN